MIRHTLRRSLLPAVAALGIAALASPAEAQQPTADDPAEYTDEYASGEFGRVAFTEGGLTVERDDLGRDDDVPLNAPIYPGDTALTGRAQRAEIQLTQGATIRLDLGTELTFFSLPNPYADFQDDTILQLVRGAIRVDSRVGDDDEFRIDTPGASIYLLGDADLRVEVTASGRTLVASRGGVAEVVGDGGSVLVRAGTQTEVEPGFTPARAEPYHTFASDAFDRWVERRADAYRVYDRYADDRAVYEDLPVEVRPYRAELSTYGSWRRHTTYGWVWTPRGIGADWRPYADGYWQYGPRGYFWVGYEPWGWAPYRFGRWVWWDGWCWVPGRVFGGAWVAWSYGSAHVGWAPLDYWDRPVVAISVSFGGYCPRSWSFVSYSHLRGRHYARYYVPLGTVGHAVDRHVVARRAVRVGPDRLAGDVEARRQAIRVARANPAQRVELSREAAGPKGDGFRRAERAVPRSRIAEASTATRGGSRTERVGARPAPGRTSDNAVRDRQMPSSRARRISAEGRRGPDTGSTPGVARPARPARPTPERAREPGTARTGRDDEARGERPGVRTPRQKAESVDSQRRDDPDGRRSIYQRMAGPRSRQGTDASRDDDARRRAPSTTRDRAATPERRTPPERTPPPRQREPERAQPQPREQPERAQPQPQRRETPERAQPQRREEPQRAQPQRREQPQRAQPQRKATPRKKDDGDRGTTSARTTSRPSRSTSRARSPRGSSGSRRSRGAKGRDAGGR